MPARIQKSCTPEPKARHDRAGVFSTGLARSQVRRAKGGGVSETSFDPGSMKPPIGTSHTSRCPLRVGTPREAQIRRSMASRSTPTTWGPPPRWCGGVPKPPSSTARRPTSRTAAVMVTSTRLPVSDQGHGRQRQSGGEARRSTTVSEQLGGGLASIEAATPHAGRRRATPCLRETRAPRRRAVRIRRAQRRPPEPRRD